MLLFLKILKTSVRITVVYKSISPLTSTKIMKNKINNTFKAPLTKRFSEVGYWELNEVPGSDGCMRQKNL